MSLPVRGCGRSWRDGGAIPFEIGEGLHDQRGFWVHQKWNAIPAHIPDASKPCLPIGSTEIYLLGHFPDAQLPKPEDVEKGYDDGRWIGRTMLLESIPDDPSLPVRRHLVRIVEFEKGEDPLVSQERISSRVYSSGVGLLPKRLRLNCCWKRPRLA